MAKGTVAAAKKETKKPVKTSSTPHPPYFQMVCEAISSLKDRTGSSQQAIAKFMEEHHSKNLPPNFKKVLSIQLKKFVQSAKLVKNKNSFKISVTEKAKVAKQSVSVEEKKKNTKESKTTVKKIVAKKVSEKAKKTKRLSQVKTPEALEKAVIGKMKKLNEVKTPDALKKNLTPMKRKSLANSSRPAPKKARN